MTTEVHLEQLGRGHLRNRIQHSDLRVQLFERTELRRFRQQPEQLVHDAQDEKCLVALIRVERPGDALAGAMAVVDGTTREAAHDELLMDGATAVAREVSAANACRLIERKFVRGIERSGDTAKRGAVPAVGHEVESTHEKVSRVAPRRDSMAEIVGEVEK
jgi:hypothetical protein